MLNYRQSQETAVKSVKIVVSSVGIFVTPCAPCCVYSATYYSGVMLVCLRNITTTTTKKLCKLCVCVKREAVQHKTKQKQSISVNTVNPL